MIRRNYNFRTLGDGSIYFLRQAPDELEGYQASESDPMHFIPRYCDCLLRSQKEISVPNCKCTKTVQFCSKLGLPVSLQYCNQDCKEPERVPLPLVNP